MYEPTRPGVFAEPHAVLQSGPQPVPVGPPVPPLLPHEQPSCDAEKSAIAPTPSTDAERA